MQRALRLAAESGRNDRALGLVMIAVCAIVVGVATYAFARTHAAAFLPSGWHRPFVNGLPWWLLAGLPTFVHGLAMPLLIAAATGSRRKRTLLTICAAWAAVEIVFETMQYPALRDALLSTLGSDTSTAGLFAALANYLQTGTFDPIDITAALLASSVACAILIRSRFNRYDSMEADHVKA